MSKPDRFLAQAWTPLTLHQLIDRIDVKCDDVMSYSRPPKNDTHALVNICRRVITAYYEELKKQQEGNSNV